MREFTEQDIIDYVDGDLPPEQAVLLEEQAEADEELAAAIVLQRHLTGICCDDLFATVFSSVDEPTERSLQAAARLATQKRKRRRLLVAGLTTVVAASLVIVVANLLPASTRALTSDPTSRILPSALLEPVAPSLVDHATFSSDGRRIAYSTHLGIVRIAPCDDLGNTILTLIGQGAPTVDIGWHENWVASISGDTRIIVWNLNSEEVVVLDGEHNAPVQSIGFSPNGAYLGSVDRNGRIVVWDTAAWGSVISAFDGYGEEDGGAAGGGRLVWSPDSTRFATKGGDRQHVIKIWAPDGDLVAKLPSDKGIVLELAWSPGQGNWLTSCNTTTVYIWNVRQRSLVTETLYEGGEVSLDWSTPDILAISTDAKRTYYQIERGVIGMENVPVPLAWSPSRDAYVTRGVGAIQVRTARNRLIDELRFHEPTSCTTLSVQESTGRYALGASDGRVHLFEATSSRVTSLASPGIGVVRVAYHPQQSFIAVAYDDGHVSVWNTDTAKLLDTIRTSGLCNALTWSPHGDRLAMAHRKPGYSSETRMCSLSNNRLQVETVFPASDVVTTLDWTPNGELLIAGLGGRGGFRIWRIADGAEVIAGKRTRAEIEARVDDVPLREGVSLAVSPDGNYLAGASAYGHWALYSLDQERLQNSFNAEDPDSAEQALLIKRGVIASNVWVYQPAWKPDSSSFALPSETGEAWLIEPHGSAQPKLVTKHLTSVIRIAWARNGRWLASGDRGGTIRFTDLGGETQHVLRGHIGLLSGLDWSGEDLITCDRNGLAFSWDPDQGVPNYYDLLGNSGVVRFAADNHVRQGNWKATRDKFRLWQRDQEGDYEIVRPKPQ